MSISSVHFHVATPYIKIDKTSWTNNTIHIHMIIAKSLIPF